ncbi:hypothetical protein C8R43DRAFT_659384 [Mycena crocata]|nr:hypothetical protein C8R43DRAFT_659384 [Mycena crocata]
MAHSAGILDLPTEILIAIFEDSTIRTDTIYYISLLCRTLHFIALPIYLRRQGMDRDLKSVVIRMRTDRRDVLSALQTALFTLQMEQITCIFPHPSCDNITHILPHLQRLREFISRLSLVQNVTLQMDDPERLCLSMCLAVGDDEALRVWAIHLEDLLNCIVRKCSNLTMMYGGQLTRSYELIPPGTPRKPGTRLSGAIQKLVGSDPKFRRVARQGSRHIKMALPSSVYNSSKLTALTIRSAILLHPPGLRWTLTALRNCPITSLTLYHNIGDPAIWTAVLPLIASSAVRLTSLELQRAEFISDTDCFDFISKLPLLTRLTISRTTSSKLRLTGPPIRLKNVEHLRAPPTVVQNLLRHPTCFPRINSIGLVWPIIDPNSGKGVFAALLSSIIQTLEARELYPSITVSVDTGICRYASFDHTNNPELSRSLDRVEVLQINAILFLFTDIPDMAAWIARFPRVRRVEIDLPQSYLDLDGDVMRSMTRMIRATEFLGRIAVNGEIYHFGLNR